jgi:uncharacterized ferredoxin-like protein
MAHLRDIRRVCIICQKTAVVELIGAFNSAYGVYCKACGNKALKRLQKQQDDDAKKEGRDF